MRKELQAAMGWPAELTAEMQGALFISCDHIIFAYKQKDNRFSTAYCLICLMLARRSGSVNAWQLDAFSERDSHLGSGIGFG